MEEPRRPKATKKPTSGVKRAKFGESFGAEGEAKSKILDMQHQIESKESELLRLRELLARNDATSVSPAKMELSRLQSAFDQVDGLCSARLKPISQLFQETQSKYEGMRVATDSYLESAKERDASVAKLQLRIQKLTNELESVEAPEVSDDQFLPLIHEGSKIQSDIDTLRIDTLLRKFEQKSISSIGDAISKQISEMNEKNSQISKHLQTLKRENMTLTAPKKQEITEEWVLARHRLEKLRIMLEDAKRSLKHLTDTAEQLNQSTSKANEELSAVKEELKTMARYLPGAIHDDGPKCGEGVARSDLTVIRSQKDILNSLLTKARMKTKSYKVSLEKLQSKAKELPDVLKKCENELSQAKIEKANVEEDIERAQKLKAELFARQRFEAEEANLLKERIEEQSKALSSIKEETNKANEQIERQKVIMQMNEAMQNLKEMDIDRFESTISNLIDIQGKMK